MNANLTKNVEILGEWFLPNSEKKQPGIFRYINGQSTLQLLRPFEIKHSSRTPFSIDMIYGDTGNGPATLTNTYFQHTFTHGTVYTATFGLCLDENRSVDGIAFDFDVLNEWAQSSHARNSTSFDSIMNTLERYESRLGNVLCELLVSLAITANQANGTRIFHTSNFLLKDKKRIDLHELVDYVICIKFFLAMVTGKNPNLRSMNHLEGNHNCDIFLPVLKKDSKGSPNTHFFNLLDVKDDYEKIIVNWFEFYRQNKYLLNLFLSTIKTDWVEPMDFFIYASILDGYCKFISNTRQCYEKRVRMVLEPFRNDFANLDDFISKVSQMRHDHFHFNKRDKIDEELVSKITHDLYFLIRVIFLRHIGVKITTDRISQIKDLAFLEFRRKG